MIEQKSKNINIRISESDLEILRKNAEEHGMSISRFIIFKCVEEPNARQTPDAIAELVDKVNFLEEEFMKMMHREGKKSWQEGIDYKEPGTKIED